MIAFPKSYQPFNNNHLVMASFYLPAVSHIFFLLGPVQIFWNSMQYSLSDCIVGFSPPAPHASLKKAIEKIGLKSFSPWDKFLGTESFLYKNTCNQRPHFVAHVGTNAQLAHC